ncbi:hypothetical protein SAMN05216175_104244 [Neptunomonas qingdaonensis]|uniref:Uncharacterized protein n=1 Tax=Neptunomonas qingdaonensis TaxID=1045558 RepID=A0A1I2QDB0_9GAMM|nr:hypothetical protein SAMN05216175_104244 [Neptunomonas qingdaonensis]
MAARIPHAGFYYLRLDIGLWSEEKVEVVINNAFMSSSLSSN